MLRALLLELAKALVSAADHVQCTTRRLAQRFVPGEDLAAAVDAARRSNLLG